MPRSAVADFVDAFFKRTLFQADDRLAALVLSEELASDANICINGTSLSSSDFITLITTQFRSTFTAYVVEIKDLNVVTTNDSGSTGVAGQWTAYVTRGMKDEKELKQSATTIVKVEEREGKRLITGISEVQTVDDA